MFAVFVPFFSPNVQDSSREQMNDSAGCSYHLNRLMPQAQLAHRPSVCISCISLLRLYVCDGAVASACCTSVKIVTEQGWRKAETVVCPLRGKQNH